jgi:hypothetical protein
MAEMRDLLFTTRCISSSFLQKPARRLSQKLL